MACNLPRKINIEKLRQIWDSQFCSPMPFCCKRFASFAWYKQYWISSSSIIKMQFNSNDDGNEMDRTTCVFVFVCVCMCVRFFSQIAAVVQFSILISCWAAITFYIPFEWVSSQRRGWKFGRMRRRYFNSISFSFNEKYLKISPFYADASTQMRPGSRREIGSAFFHGHIHTRHGI